MPLNLGVIPLTWLVPGVYLGVDNSNALAGLPPQRKPIVLTIFTTRREKDAEARSDVLASAARIVVETLGASV